MKSIVKAPGPDNFMSGLFILLPLSGYNVGKNL